MSLTTDCTLCLEALQPQKGSDESGAPEDKRPVQSQKCHHTPYCVDCFQALLAHEDNKRKKWFPCPVCYKKKAFHKDEFWVNHIYCVLLAKTSDLAVPPDLTPDRWTATAAPATDKQTAEEPIARSSRRRRAPTRLGHSPPAQRRRTDDTNPVVRNPPLPRRSGDNTRPASESSDNTPLPAGELANQNQPASNDNDELQVVPPPTLVNRPRFTRDAFMSKQIFHVNPRIRDKEQRNRGFGPFIASGGASPGFNKVTPFYLQHREEGKNNEQLLDFLVGKYGYSDERNKSTLKKDIAQVHMWHTQVQVGDFIFMRHEYPTCPLMPPRLLDEEDNYIGPVYVLGVITHLPRLHQPGIEGFLHMERMSEEEQNGLVAFCRVEYLRMGKKQDLEGPTRKYISAIQQPTLNKICGVGKEWPKSRTNAQKVRLDLWNQASIPIAVEEFR